MSLVKSDLSRKIAILSRRDDSFFKPLSVPVQWGCSDRPILIIVHPGDAIESPEDGWGKPEDSATVVRQALANQEAMAAEIQALLPSSDVVILHRASSDFMHRNTGKLWIHPSYTKAIANASSNAAVLYGDDLDSASKWIITHALGSMTTKNKKSVHLTGAYSDARYGCITEIGKALADFNPFLHISVSQHAPTDNSSSAPRWDPQAPKMSSAAMGANRQR